MPCRLQAVMLICPILLIAGCFGFPARLPARAEVQVPQFRASAQSAPPVTVTPPPPPNLDSANPDESPLHRLAMKAAESEKTLNSYIVRVRRHDMTDGKEHPEEIILCKFRRAPLSILCKWLGTEAHGREILYVKDQHEDKIHVITGQGDFLGPGRKMALPPDSALVRKNLRYPVTEASLGAVAIRFTTLVDAIENGQHNKGSAKYLSEQNRPEFPLPVEAVEQTIPAGLEPGLTRGGVRFYYFDPVLNIPTVVVTFDHNRRQVEYFSFDRLQAPVDLDDADFDPNVIWKR